MKKERHQQLELFAQSKIKDSGSFKKGLSGSFSNFIWNYQKSILVTFLFIATVIVSFCLGVEKGKKITVSKLNFRINTAVKIQPEPVSPVPPSQIVPSRPQVDKQGYTIQLASYKTKTYAQKEADKLKKRGLLPLVISKGRYIVLCVGNFSDKETAKSSLAKLKKKYQGCYLRRL